MSIKRILTALSVLLLSVVTSSCQQIEGEDPSGDQVLSSLKLITEYFQKASDENKIVQHLLSEADLYEFTFTDGSSVKIRRDSASGAVAGVESDGRFVTLILSDGVKFVFPLLYAVPTGIDVKSEMVALSRGGESMLLFNLTPFDSSFAPKELSLECSGRLFTLASVSANLNSEGKPVQGHYTARIKDLGVDPDYVVDSCAFVITTKGPDGEPLEIRSKNFTVRSASYKGVNTGLPFVIINTPDAAPIASKTEWIAGAEFKILNPDLTLDCQGSLSVKGRGNSTWSIFPKKPYAMKLETKTKVLGMNKSKRWCLLANFMDRTLMRNAVAFEVSRKTGLEWTPSGRFVELFLNGEHLGNYYLCEQIKIDEKKVNLTDGYIFECDTWFDEEFKFYSSVHNVPWTFKDPDVVTQAEVETIQNYVTAFEHALFDPDKFARREYLQYLDEDSFIDWWLVNEICQNSECNQPKSAYLHMEKGGKLVAGPVWDFDWGTFHVRDKYLYVSLGQKYYTYQIFQDPAYRQRVKERWALYKDKLFNDIPLFIDALAAQLAESDKINHEMWPINRTTNQDETLSFPEACAKLKKAYLGKLQWLDETIQNY